MVANPVLVLGSYAALGMAIIFLGYWSYVYVYIPDQMASFYNGGAGTAWVDPTNSSKNLTLYSNSDERVIYSWSVQSQDYIWVEWGRGIAWLVGTILILGSAAVWMLTHNVSGKKVG